MRNKIAAFIVAALLCITFTSCAKPDSPQFGSQGSSHSTSVTLPSNVQLPAPTQSGFKNLSTVGNAVLGCGGDDGFYETYPAQNGSINMVYIDYASAQEIYLCTTPNCEHNSEACSSWIPAEDAGLFPLVTGTHLLLVNRTYGMETGKAAIPRIDHVNLDGTGRKTLIQFGVDEYLEDVFAGNDNTLVCAIRARDESDELCLKLVSIDLTTGSRTDFYKTSLNEDAQKLFIGMTENGYCILQHTLQSKSADDFPGLDEKAAFEASAASVVYEWYAVPLGSSDAAAFYCESADGVSARVFENGLCIFNQNTMELSLLSPADGSRTVVSNLSVAEFNSSRLGGKIGDWILIDTRAYEDDSVVAFEHRYAVNTNDGTVKEFTLLEEDERGTLCPYLLASDSNYVLLITDETGSNKHYGFTYSVISKEDYINSIDSCRAVRFIENQ